MSPSILVQPTQKLGCTDNSAMVSLGGDKLAESEGGEALYHEDEGQQD